MAEIQVTTPDGDTINVDEQNVKLPEGYDFVTPDRVPEGYVKQDVVDEKIKDRVSKAKKNERDNAKQDPEFKQMILEEYGVQLDENGKPKTGQDQDFQAKLEAERKKWEEQNLKPYQDQVEQYKQTNNKLRKGAVNAQLLRAANGKFQDPYVQAPVEGAEPYVTKVFGDQFDVEPETGIVAKVDKEGNFEYHPNGKQANGHGYITPDDFIQLHADKQGFKELLKDNRNGSSGFQGGQGSGNKIRISYQDAKNHSKMKAAQKQANEQGKELEITE